MCWFITPFCVHSLSPSVFIHYPIVCSFNTPLCWFITPFCVHSLLPCVFIHYSLVCSFITPLCVHSLLWMNEHTVNDPTHPVRHYFDSRRSNRSGSFLLPRTNTNRYKPRFYSRLCQFLMKMIPVTNWVCAYVKTSVSNGGLGMCQPNDFYLRVLRFGLTQRKHYSR